MSKINDLLVNLTKKSDNKSSKSSQNGVDDLFSV
jgi:hypothetical protein